MTFRKWLDYWTEVKRVVLVDGEPVVKQTSCCCEEPGMSRRQCSDSPKRRYPIKMPCRCYCHSTTI